MDLSPLVTSLQQQTREWLSLYGRLLHDIAKTNMAAIHAKLDKFSYDLVTDPSDLDDLKVVLQVSLILSSFYETSGTSSPLLMRLASGAAGVVGVRAPQKIHVGDVRHPQNFGLLRDL